MKSDEKPTPKPPLSSYVRTVPVGINGYGLRLDHAGGACIIVRSTRNGVVEIPGGRFAFAEHGRSASIGIALELAASLDSTAAYEEAVAAGLIRLPEVASS